MARGLCSVLLRHRPRVLSIAMLRFNEDARHEVRPSFTKGQFDCSREPLDMSHDNSEEFDDERIAFLFNTQHV